MYDRIVVGIDGSDLATKALRHAVALARHENARLYVVTSTETTLPLIAGAEMAAVNTGELIAELEEAKAQGARKVLDDAKAIGKTEDQEMEVVHIASSLPADAILSVAKEKKADLIVMGSHGRRGLGRLLLGSQASEVLAHSDIPVLIVK